MDSQGERKKQRDFSQFFLDRSLGDVQVPAILRDSGWKLFPMYEVYGQAIAQGLDDPPWIEEVSTQGLVILTKDTKFRYIEEERKAVEQARARVFCLASAKKKAPWMAKCFNTNRWRIEQACRKSGPYIYKVYENSIDKWWP